MKNYLAVLLTSLLLLLSACSTSNDAEDNTEASATEETNEDTPDTTEDNNEANDLEKENEELKQQLAEKENEKLKKKLEESDSEETEIASDDSKSDVESKSDTNITTVGTPEECVLNLLRDCRNDFDDHDIINAYLELVESGKIEDTGVQPGMNEAQVVDNLENYYLEPEHNSTSQDSDDIEFKTWETISYEYVTRLADYYNDVDTIRGIFYYLHEGSPAYNKVTANKATGNFAEHTVHNVSLEEITDNGDGTVTLRVSREYTHATSNGKSHVIVDYLVNKETHEFIDYEEIF
ncbi:hypothetical protein [Corticicoccus populi]|uniref:Uncharacterized protein n=1 Tax=Corticicoccus populi TaxID=1812821 RepID=A0ABW5WY86_9STAP